MHIQVCIVILTLFPEKLGLFPKHAVKNYNLSVLAHYQQSYVSNIIWNSLDVLRA